ncbi:UNVERIFIED_CONTAM: hypothetical protein GTU68_036282 [Idotea baltica]|nr:hypothetical protein [Idotea baltica]
MSLHISAKLGEIAETVLLPGDPIRAKFIADTFLENPKCYNEIRGMLGYTGTYKGKRISVQGSGMGMPSLGIYATELLTEYGVKQVIRIGSCGSIQKELTLGQVIIATSASGDSGANKIIFGGMDFAASADFTLLSKAYDIAQRLNIHTVQGNIFSTDAFYRDDPKRWDVWAEHGVLAVEMESQMLYTLAAKYGARGLALLTVSDNIITGEATTADERVRSFTDMMKIALELAE